jgi:hypothetical protein
MKMVGLKKKFMNMKLDSDDDIRQNLISKFNIKLTDAH